MILIDEDVSIYIYNNRVDFRKNIDGLSGLVDEEMQLDPYSRAVFIFLNRRRDKVKLLYWDKSGFLMIYKRLEEEKFIMSRKNVDKVLTITRAQFEWFFNGYDIWKMKGHRELNFSVAA